MPQTRTQKIRQTTNWLALDWIVLTTGVLMLAIAVMGTVANAVQAAAEKETPRQTAADFTPI